MERRSPTGIARERETRPNNPTPRQSHRCEPTHRHPRRITGTWSAGLRPASRGSSKPAPMTVRRTDVSGAPPAQSGLRCSLRFAQRCRPEVGVPVLARRLCSIGIAPSARLRRAVPTRGRRSLACRSRRAPKVKGRILPFTLSPEIAGSERSSLPFVCCALGSTPPAQNHGGAPVSDRHRAGARNLHRRRCAPPISPLRTTYRRSAQNREDGGAPVSDRHRAGARNPPQRRCAPPISRERTTYRRSALNRGDGLGNADLRSAPLGEAQRATYHHPRRIAGTWSAGLRSASRGSAKPAPMTVRRTDTRVWRI